MQQYEKLSRAEFGKLLPDISLTNQSGLLKEMSPQKKEMFRNQTRERDGSWLLAAVRVLRVFICQFCNVVSRQQ